MTEETNEQVQPVVPVTQSVQPSTAIEGGKK